MAKEANFWWTPTGRLLWPHLVTPQDSEDKKHKIYSLQLNVPKGKNGAFPTVLQPMKDVLVNACIQKWGSDWAEEVELPFIDGDTAKKYKNKEFNQGHICIPMKSYNFQPAMGEIDDDGAVSDMDMIEQREKLYAGCFVMCTYNFYTYENKNKSGIAVGLRTVIKVGEGEKVTTQADTKADWAGQDLRKMAGTMKGSSEDSEV
jgi:hypothetical protein